MSATAGQPLTPQPETVFGRVDGRPGTGSDVIDIVAAVAVDGECFE